MFNRQASKAMKKPVFKTDLYTLNFKRSAPFQCFNCQYKIHHADRKAPSSAYMVHFSTLIATCKEFDLEFLSINNFQNVYEVSFILRN